MTLEQIASLTLVLACSYLYLWLLFWTREPVVRSDYQPEPVPEPFEDRATILPTGTVY